MIGLDTNVLVRYFAQDDPRQSPQATRLVEAMSVDDPGYICVLALAELVWVLRDNYGMNRDEISNVVRTLLQSDTAVVQSPAIVWQALRAYETGRADLADHLIERLGVAAGCHETVTFDRHAARSAGMRLLESR